ncbi:hypothetical protein K6K41_18860 [Chenggangzhangella methanolivorans]|uniref:Uncharacterized protein n=1 Tax=Chenggangzhangella methanolivorans TaxID=1437009 RepID=A0A9E6UQG6_9HYPH|nr:hypothetical protein [Chenggangzhangella methanolivorans]QZO02554.1 hypothetical protein K6K41_18860 [Chenggangzhangella methanolivorans]
MSDAARREPLLVLGELMGNSERDLGRRFELLRRAPTGLTRCSPSAERRSAGSSPAAACPSTPR